MMFSRVILMAVTTVLGWLFLIIAGLMLAVALVTWLRGDADVNHAGLLTGAVVFCAMTLAARWLVRAVRRLGN
jgi:hypothetical protein